MSDPKYVRLSQRMSTGTQVDLNTGWAISGLDVKKFPEHPAAKAFVKYKLNAGILEAASQAEYEEVKETSDAIAEMEAERQSGNLARSVARKLGLPSESRGHQEATLQEVAQNSRKRLLEARGEAGGLSAADRRRRKKILAQRGGSGQGDLSGVMPAGANSGEGDDEDTELPEDLTDLKADELRAELSKRGLETSGNKPDLVARLEEALEEEEEDEDDES